MIRFPALLGLILTASPLVARAQAPVPAAEVPEGAQVTWDSGGITIRFPRFLSPDSITFESRVGG